MLKTALKNYFASLKYFFTPLGTLFLGMLVGLSVLAKGVKAEIEYVVGNVNEIVGEAKADYGELKGYVIESANALSWDNPTETLLYLGESDWLAQTVSAYLDTLSGDVSAYSEKLTITVQTAAEELKAYLGAFAALSLLGLLGGSVLTKYIIRRSTARRKFSKYILVTAVDSVLSVTLVAFCAWLLAVWAPGGLISAAASVLLFGCISLFEAYLVQGDKTLAWKEIVNPKNAVLLFVSHLCILVVSMGAVGLVALIFGSPVAVVAAFPLSVVALSVVSLNAEAYVLDRKTAAALRPGACLPGPDGKRKP